MATRQAIARRAVEDGYVPPAPTFVPRAPTPDERPAVGARLARIGNEAGFTIRESFARSYGPPKWRRTGSTDPADFYPELADVYSIGGLLRPFPLETKAATTKAIAELDDGRLYAFQAVYADSAPIGAIIYSAGARRVASNVTTLEKALKQLLG